MDSLDRAIELMTRGKADRQKALARLEAVMRECEAAGQVWAGYIAKPGKPGDQWTIVSWVGPERAKQLHEINLRAKQHVEEVCCLAGPASGRFAALDEDVIEMAYRMLTPGETGMSAAESAVQKMQQRMDYVRGLMQQLRAAKPAQKKTAARITSRKTAVKKVPAKKTAKKATKSAKPKSANKKAPAKK